MKNEVNVMENDLSVIEQNHRNQILAIHENMQDLLQKCQDIQVFEDDKQSYDNAVELKRLVKNVHVSIDKKRKELKQPVIDYVKKLDAFVKEIYEQEHKKIGSPPPVFQFAFSLADPWRRRRRRAEN